jgi:23S rRNA pseudouridine2605 synthase
VPNLPGLTYVGRLDVMTSGLLLMTNDGEAAHRLMHPKFAVERSYRVVVHGRSQADVARVLNQKITIDGRVVNITDVKVRPARGKSVEVLLVLCEGRYRIVRRVCEVVGLKVERLVRLSYGPIRLGKLAAGEWRYLARPELAALGFPSPSRVRKIRA